MASTAGSAPKASLARLSPARIATIPATSSAARIVSPEDRITPSSTTGRMPLPGLTRSRCAQRITGSPSPARPITFPAASISTSRPMTLSLPATAAAISPSSPDSASMLTSSTNSSTSACCIRITTPRDLSLFPWRLILTKPALSSTPIAPPLSEKQSRLCQQTVGAQHQPPTNTAAMGKTKGPHYLRRASTSGFTTCFGTLPAARREGSPTQSGPRRGRPRRWRRRCAR